MYLGKVMERLQKRFTLILKDSFLTTEGGKFSKYRQGTSSDGERNFGTVEFELPHLTAHISQNTIICQLVINGLSSEALLDFHALIMGW